MKIECYNFNEMKDDIIPEEIYLCQREQIKDFISIVTIKKEEAKA